MWSAPYRPHGSGQWAVTNTPALTGPSCGSRRPTRAKSASRGLLASLVLAILPSLGAMTAAPAGPVLLPIQPHVILPIQSHVILSIQPRVTVPIQTHVNLMTQQRVILQPSPTVQSPRVFRVERATGTMLGSRSTIGSVSSTTGSPAPLKTFDFRFGGQASSNAANGAQGGSGPPGPPQPSQAGSQAVSYVGSTNGVSTRVAHQDCTVTSRGPRCH